MALRETILRVLAEGPATWIQIQARAGGNLDIVAAGLVVALATLCALGAGGLARLFWVGWWDVACLLCVLVAPVVWATSSIIWNLGDDTEASPATAAMSGVWARLADLPADPRFPGAS